MVLIKCPEVVSLACVFQNLIISVCKSFETTIYHLGEKEDFITHNLKKNSFNFVKNSKKIPLKKF